VKDGEYSIGLLGIGELFPAVEVAVVLQGGGRVPCSVSSSWSCSSRSAPAVESVTLDKSIASASRCGHTTSFSESTIRLTTPACVPPLRTSRLSP
jgi:hypothetical protein